jgi:uncharacterized protein
LIVYFDTSAFVPIVVEEEASATAARLWSDADRVVSSRLLYAEARAALGMARRTGRLGGEQLREAVVTLEELVINLDVVEVTDILVRRAGTLAEDLRLRGYDAVHLASAEAITDADLVFASGDSALLEAATTLRLSVANLRGPQS